ncbi:GGDEF domain-containing protein [Microvirga sp. HBU67558]|uniref:GGDEF domain-containing protein n=1 Tax=Microvirga TaxID=186650 RepID=UPI001B3724F5|nr:MULTISPECIES: GGDEF domain-containing protein [unclassified Microvirga]MBQ0821510.1 GGDEF domain-containing protein [Microvirga sp. HBU67558]
MPGRSSIPSPFRSNPIPADLVRLLYTALPQVASVTTGVVVGAWLMAWRTGSEWDWLLAWLAIGMAAVRLGLLAAFYRTGADKDLSPAAARGWEFAYGAGSLLMAAVIAGMSLRALSGTDAGVQLLCLGLTMATCAGQSSTRVAWRAWIPISTGSVVLAAFAGGCLLHADASYRIVGGLLLLYGYSHIEACRHGARNLVALHRAQRSLAHRAAHDDLTGLPNRAVFRKCLMEASEKFERDGQKYAVLALDLDGFKHVNDAHGHATGDDLLRQFADRMRHALREGNVVARLGGDEFAVLQRPVAEPDAAVRLAECLIAEISRPYGIEGRTIAINVSVGIAMAPECGDGEALLRAADAASYEAKRAGKGLYRLASPGRHWPITA